MAKTESRMPARIFAQASTRSAGGVSVFSAGAQIGRRTYGSFYSEDRITDAAVERLGNAGFEILYVTRSTINIAGTQKQYEAAFDASLVTEEREVLKPQGNATSATFIECPSTNIPGLIPVNGTEFADILEGVAIEEPRYYMQPSAFPPIVDYWHLSVPQGVSLGCNADKAHRGGVTGAGVHVAMVDSGWYRHPFFVTRGYRANPVVLGPGASRPEADESGHGTGESANIFSVAPDAELTPIKMSFTNANGAFDMAVDLSPDIITCSWGSSRRTSLSAADQLLAASIAEAVDAGIVVVFSAGNGHWGFPGQHPDVISAGGAYMSEDMSVQASDYASGFMSEIYTSPPRRVPDLSGLVGMRPRAIYIMLPLEPGDAIDTGSAGGSHPNGDETAPDDGWAAFSGTSAAAPQLAGAAALVRQACPDLDPEEVRSILNRSARDVTAGRASPATDQTGTGAGNPATEGVDSATGHGLVDAYRAVVLAKARCADPNCEPVDEAAAEGAAGGAGTRTTAMARRTAGVARPRGAGTPGHQAAPRRPQRLRLSPEERRDLEDMAENGRLELDDFGRR